MDIISHAIVGRMLISKKSNTFKDLIFVPFFGALPDIFQIPLYVYIGYINSRPFFYPLTSDWNGFRDLNPLWVLWWDIPHSLFFLLLVVTPIVLLLKLNN
ncbi:MAG: hypothetical protein IPL71_14160 [Anaerolineales bacterium]|uniref:hypothetical protein n=1 Tax=Candidatus Villigracilis proximus TaxID=3140683 RepID=UPI0031352FE1|nr:hypothetical protein [Anaerolineales bacterium]